MSLSSSGKSWGQFTLPVKKESEKTLGTFGGYVCEPGPSQGMGVPVMPQPGLGPWNMQGVPWGMAAPQPALVEFTGAPMETNKQNKIVHCKRKSSIEFNKPSKQLITDEKMAAHFNSLRISVDGLADDDSGDEGFCGMDDEGEAPREAESSRLRRVVLCEEMKKLKSEPILPLSLLQRLEKPCTSLVLWQPPRRLDNPQEEQQDPNNNPGGPRPSTSGLRRGVLLANNQDVDMDM